LVSGNVWRQGGELEVFFDDTDDIRSQSGCVRSHANASGSTPANALVLVVVVDLVLEIGESRTRTRTTADGSLRGVRVEIFLSETGGGNAAALR
jgi:hypothetical protein